MSKLYYSQVNDTLVEILADGGVVVYKRVGNPPPPEDTEDEEAETPKKRRGRQPKADKPAYGDKTREIEICVKEGRSVKETITRLKPKFPTITPSDVYQIRGKMKKAEPSDSFTARPPSTEEGGQDGMIKKYGKGTVEKVIDLSLLGYKTDAIAHHHEVRLTTDQVDEIIKECDA